MMRTIAIISIKVRFILDIINEKVNVRNIPKKEIVEQLKNLKYPKVLNTKLNNKISRIVLNDDDYKALSKSEKENCNWDFLLDMSLYNLTKEKVDSLKNEKDELQTKFDDLRSKTPKNLWIEDLDEFLVEYNKFMKDYYKENGLKQSDYEVRKAQKIDVNTFKQINKKKKKKETDT